MLDGFKLYIIQSRRSLGLGRARRHAPLALQFRNSDIAAGRHLYGSSPGVPCIAQANQCSPRLRGLPRHHQVRLKPTNDSVAWDSLSCYIAHTNRRSPRRYFGVGHRTHPWISGVSLVIDMPKQALIAYVRYNQTVYALRSPCSTG